MHSHLFSIQTLATDSYEKSSSEAFCLSEKFGKTVTLVKKSPLDELKVSKAKKFILKGSLMINWNLRTVGGWLSPTEKTSVGKIWVFLYFLPWYSSWVLWLQVFDRWLLDAEWSLNAGNWMWLSYSAFFQQFFNCLCPVGFGRKLDPNGDYVRLVHIDVYHGKCCFKIL